MKLSEEQIRKIIQEEISNITEEMTESEEKRIARYVYILMGEALEKIHDYLGENENNESSDEFLKIFDSVAKTWKLLDQILTGGETRDALPGIFENEDKEDE
jgi:RecG-like helicase